MLLLGAKAAQVSSLNHYAWLIFGVRRLLHDYVVWVPGTSEYQYGTPVQCDSTWRALASVAGARMPRLLYLTMPSEYVRTRKGRFARRRHEIVITM
jgi:hypothetical protein